MKTQVGAGERPFKASVIVKHQFRQPNHFRDERYLYFPGRRSVVAQRTEFPFHIDDAAVVRRQFSFRYLFHKRVRRFFLI